jgi:hypothetical protein
MGLINWIFDFYQQYRIDQIRDEQARTRSEAVTVRGPAGQVDVERLERAIGELALATKTMQRMMVEKGVCTPDELAQKVRAVDLEDGAPDGRAPMR